MWKLQETGTDNVLCSQRSTVCLWYCLFHMIWCEKADPSGRACPRCGSAADRLLGVPVSNPAGGVDDVCLVREMGVVS